MKRSSKRIIKKAKQKRTHKHHKYWKNETKKVQSHASHSYSHTTQQWNSTRPVKETVRPAIPNAQYIQYSEASGMLIFIEKKNGNRIQSKFKFSSHKSTSYTSNSSWTQITISTINIPNINLKQLNWSGNAT